jgi:predicted metalloprotease with PDZ domain
MHNDEQFRNMLRFLNKKFYHQTVTTQDIQDAMTGFTGFNLTGIFNQYLRTVQVPVLEYYMSPGKEKLFFRWTNCVDGFDLPVYVGAGDQQQLIRPVSTEWRELLLPAGGIERLKPEEAAQYFYIKVKQVDGIN